MIHRRLVLSLLGLLLAGAAVSFGAGEVLSRPASRIIGSPPADFAAEVVRIETEPGQFVVGWYARGARSEGAVLLLHGVRGDRAQMLKRARFLADAGYSSLSIDLPSHGESSGERITFGAREGAGVRAAIAFLRRESPREPLGIIGVSLGAASTVLAQVRPAPQAVVLESMYPTIEEAVTDRMTMRLGPVGEALTPLLLWQIPLRSGIKPTELHPIEKLPNLGAPVLIASGSEDQHTKWSETTRLYAAAAAPKEIWQVEGAAHVDLHDFAPEEYERRILKFLGKYLRNEA